MIKNSSSAKTKQKAVLLVAFVLALVALVGPSQASASAYDLHPETGSNSYSTSSRTIKLHRDDFGRIKVKVACFLGQYILNVNAMYPETTQWTTQITNFLLPYCPPVTPVDGEAPSSVNLTVTDISQYSATVEWTAATDNVGVDHYNVYVDGVVVASTNNLTYTLNRPCGTFNDIMVSAVDAAGNFSTSAIIGLPTTSCP